MKKIILEFDNLTGETKLETKGFEGKQCIEETKFLKEVLGKTIAEKKTPEYYKVTTKSKNKLKKIR